ncbi:MAG: STAS domain-containing protein [Brevinematales bacterium]|jgi:anti-anti-sigma factor
MQENSRVIIGIITSGYIIKVIGKGTMEYCSELFQFLSEKIENEKAENVYFELSETTYLDSSFIGVIVSVQKKLKKASNGNLILLNPSDKTKEILSTMGLLDIMPIQENDTFKNIEISSEIKKKLEKNYQDIQVLLESHQNLMELSSENRKRFSLVEEMLKKELEKEKK